MHSLAAPTALMLDEPAHATAPARSMRERVPAQALIEQVLQIQAKARRRGRIERFFGRGPLDADARSWYAGAEGERVVAALLTALPSGWTVLHSLPVGRDGADIDHLVVGPAGVFTVNTKHHVDASVWVAGRTVLVAGNRQPYVARAEAEARRVDRLLADALPPEAGRACPAVRALIAVVGARRVTVRDEPRLVAVVRAEALGRHLLRQPERLSPDEVQRCLTVLADPSVWQPSVEAQPDLLVRFGRLQREIRRAARIRLAWALGAAAIPAAAALTALPFLHL